jgi:hypothetical protein
MRPLSRALAVITLTLLGTSAAAQSINISFGHTNNGPSSSYAAAGAPGVWNTITGISGTSFPPLVATDGSATNVTVSQSPTTTLITNTDPSVHGDDAALLNYGLDTSGAETCLSFSGFAAGTYEVLIYAWLPLQATVKSRTRQDSAPSTIDVGGAWTGAHVAGVTYARYVVTVSQGGSLPAHSGLVPGAPNAALNGIQIRPLSTVTDAGSGTDAGTGGGRDAGGGTGEDAGGGSSTDAGTGTGHDAGVGSGADAGGGSGSDAGVASGHDAGAGSGADAGEHSGQDSGPGSTSGSDAGDGMGGGGCATGGGLTSAGGTALLVALLLIGVASRKRRYLR